MSNKYLVNKPFLVNILIIQICIISTQPFAFAGGGKDKAISLGVSLYRNVHRRASQQILDTTGNRADYPMGSFSGRTPITGTFTAGPAPSGGIPSGGTRTTAVTTIGPRAPIAASSTLTPGSLTSGALTPRTLVLNAWNSPTTPSLLPPPNGYNQSLLQQRALRLIFSPSILATGADSEEYKLNPTAIPSLSRPFLRRQVNAGGTSTGSSSKYETKPKRGLQFKSIDEPHSPPTIDLVRQRQKEIEVSSPVTLESHETEETQPQEGEDLHASSNRYLVASRTAQAFALIYSNSVPNLPFLISHFKKHYGQASVEDILQAFAILKMAKRQIPIPHHKLSQLSAELQAKYEPAKVGRSKIYPGTLFEGSVEHRGKDGTGHLICDFHTSIFEPAIRHAEELRKKLNDKELTRAQVAAQLAKYVSTHVLQQSPYACPLLKGQQRASTEDAAQPLSIAVMSGVADCRPHSIILSYLLNVAGIEAEYSNQKVEHRTKVNGIWGEKTEENHSVVIYPDESGKMRVADSYFPKFNSISLDDLKGPKGHIRGSDWVRFERQNNFPKIYAPKQQVISLPPSNPASLSERTESQKDEDQSSAATASMTSPSAGLAIEEVELNVK